MNRMNAKIKTATLMLFLLAVIPLSGSSENGSRNQAQNMSADHPQINNEVVYVCACLKTKSCPCMTEAKTEGPCACGTSGGPPLKAVPKNGAWAKANRKALGQ